MFERDIRSYKVHVVSIHKVTIRERALLAKLAMMTFVATHVMAPVTAWTGERPGLVLQDEQLSWRKTRSMDVVYDTVSPSAIFVGTLFIIESMRLTYHNTLPWSRFQTDDTHCSISPSS